MSHHIGPGMAVVVRTAYGAWVPKVAVSEVEPGHTFPIIWVESVEERGDPVPWPAEDVKLAEDNPDSVVPGR